MFVGQDYTIVTRDLRTLIYYFTLNSVKDGRELWVPAWDGIQQAQSGSSSRSGRNQGAAVEADAIGE